MGKPLGRWATLHCSRALAIVLAFAASHATSFADESVVSIEAFLVSGQTGKLSYDIADQRNQYSFWNTLIADGVEVEPSNDVLIVAHIIRQKEADLTTPVVITAKVHDSGVIFQKRETSNLLFLDGNRAAVSMLVQDMPCANIDILVSTGNGSKSLNLPFAYGE